MWMKKSSMGVWAMLFWLGMGVGSARARDMDNERTYRLRVGASRVGALDSGSGWFGIACDHPVEPWAAVAGSMEAGRGQRSILDPGQQDPEVSGVGFTQLSWRLGAALRPVRSLRLSPGVWAGVTRYDTPLNEEAPLLESNRTRGSGGAYFEGTFAPVASLEFGPRLEAGVFPDDGRPLSMRLSLFAGAVF